MLPLPRWGRQHKVGPAISRGAVYDVVHANSEFTDQVSDHDPVLLSFGAIPAAVPERASVALLLAGLLVVGCNARRRG